MTLVFGKHKRLQIKWLAVPLIVLMLVGILSSCTLTGEVDKVDSDSPTTKITEQTIPTALYDEDSVISLYENSIPAVVMVIVEIESNNNFSFTAPQGGQGSGFIIDEQGHIITNNHVVENASKVTVILHDDRRLEAEVMGTDRESDVALLQVDTGKLGEVKPLLLGDSDNIKPGQIAIALGSPFGLGGSITIGIISGIDRSLSSAGQRPIPEIIQTDAAINPGNSGGPLLNSAGEVIGINTAIEVSSTGIGFVVPINTVKSLLPALLKGGEVKNPWLGISAVAISPNLIELLELSVSSGIYVVTVTAGSPAEKVGLIESGSDESGLPSRGGDIITAVDEIEVSAVEDLVAYLNDKEPGDKISLSVHRGNDYFTVEVTLGEWPEEL
ncbi:S1C family serine protease [Chloroflexota bacterium]